MSTNLAYQKPYPILDPEKMKGRDNKAFIADDDLLAAANVALALGRPLLLTGEPGCGKTDFAFAAASGLVDAATRDHQQLLSGSDNMLDLLEKQKIEILIVIFIDLKKDTKCDLL